MSEELAPALASRRLARLSLGFSSQTAVNVGMMTCLPVGLVATLLGAAQPWPLVLMGGWLAVFAPVYVRRSQAMGRRWLEGLALPLDREGYLAALDVPAARGGLQVVATVAGGATATLPGLGRLGEGWVEPGRVTIVSPQLGTFAFGISAVPHNGVLHRWFAAVADQVLLPVHRQTPLERVEVHRVKSAPVAPPAR